ncbi:MAG: hypothetical protein Q7S29_05640 [Candidatus Peribacter sp.]|nr:hypothetical protein [Candidatus Peribacter sp.]
MNVKDENRTGSILLKMNFPAPFIKQNKIDDLLDSKKAADYPFIEWLETFFKVKRDGFDRKLLERFVEINNEQTFMSIFPIVHTNKFENLENALSDSCRCYCLSLDTASIALSGVAAEAMTQMIWEISKMTIKGKPIDKSKEKAIFGKEFDSPYLSQYRRLQILRACEFVSEEQFQKLDYIREKRNEVVHFDKKSSSEADKESALQCFHKTMSLFKEITNIQFDGQNIKSINQYFLTD